MWYCMHMPVCLNSLMYALTLSSCVCVCLYFLTLVTYTNDYNQRKVEADNNSWWIVTDIGTAKLSIHFPCTTQAEEGWRKYPDHTTLVPAVSRSKSVCTLVLFHIQFWSNLNAQYDMPYVWTMTSVTYSSFLLGFTVHKVGLHVQRTVSLPVTHCQSLVYYCGKAIYMSHTKLVPYLHKYASETTSSRFLPYVLLSAIV